MCVDLSNQLTEAEEMQERLKSMVKDYINSDKTNEEIITETLVGDVIEKADGIYVNFGENSLKLPEEKINEYDLTIFVQEKNQLYRKFQETHFQRGYEPDEITAILEELGFTIVRLVDSDSQEAVTETSERIFVVARCEKAAGDANSGV